MSNSDHSDATEDQWVTLSTKGLTRELAALAVVAAKMFRDDDVAAKHKKTGDIRISEEVFGRMLEVNQLAEELVKEMIKEQPCEQS